MTAKNKKKGPIELDLGTKLDLINCVRNGMSYRKAQIKFGCALGTISKVWNEREKLKTRAKTQSLKTKRPANLTENAKEIDERVFNWFNAARSRNVPVNGPILKEKALHVASSIGFHEFKASDGWLNKFKKRHSLSLKTLVGEAANVDMETVANWKGRLKNVIEGYAMEDIWNADETGLFFKMTPSKSLVEKGKKAKNGKMAKERLTICLLASAEGEKFLPFVIGKSKNPRCFNGSGPPPGSYYFANQKAWMTCYYFEKYLCMFNDYAKKKGRHFLLLLDNAPCHPSNLQLSNVKLEFLMPNTTSECQPLDAGIIKAFKLNYSKLLLKWLVPIIDDEICTSSANLNAQAQLKQFTVKDALFYISKAWTHIRTDVIKNCFKHCGIGGEESYDVNAAFKNESYELRCQFIGIPDTNFDDFVPTCDLLQGDWEQIVLNSHQDSTESTEDEEEITQEIIQVREAVLAICKLEKYVKQNHLEEYYDPLFKLSDELAEKAISCKKQSTLDDFFGK